MKPALPLPALLLSASFACAQGTVVFQNGLVTFDTMADRLVYADYVGGTRLVGTNFAAGLWFVPGADNGAMLLSPTGGTQAGALAFFRLPTTVMPGVWVNNGQAGNYRTLDGVGYASWVTLQVRVWDITKYSTFEQAFQAGEYGWSTPFNLRTQEQGSDFPIPLLNGLRAFALIPEPSTFALGLAVAAGWLAVRLRSLQRLRRPWVARSKEMHPGKGARISRTPRGVRTFFA
jgi:hypothetical protein